MIIESITIYKILSMLELYNLVWWMVVVGEGTVSLPEIFMRLVRLESVTSCVTTESVVLTKQ